MMPIVSFTSGLWTIVESRNFSFADSKESKLTAALVCTRVILAKVDRNAGRLIMGRNEIGIFWAILAENNHICLWIIWLWIKMNESIWLPGARAGFVKVKGR